MHAPARSRDWRALRRPATLGLALLTSLALASSALAASFKLTTHIANHSPIVNRNWPITIDVTSGKKKLSGSVRYQFLYSGTVVSTQKGHAFKHGVYTDQMLFPPTSLGEPLTLRILVTVPRYGTEHIDWKVTAHR